MTEGTSQGLFIVVAIVIFGIFVSLSYTLFGSQGLTNDLQNIYLDATGQVTILFDDKVSTSEEFFSFDENTRTITNYSDDGPKEVIIPRSINGITVKKIGPKAFTDKGLTSVEFPDTIDEIIGSTTTYIGAFTGNKLGNFTVPGSLKTLGTYSFTGAGITNLTLEDGVENINGHAFHRNSVPEINFPKSIKHIGSYSFTGVGLTKVTFKGSLDTIDSWSFRTNNIQEFTIPKGTKRLGRQIIEGNLNLKELNIPKELKSKVEANDNLALVKTSKYNTGTSQFYDYTYYLDSVLNYY